MIQPKKDFIAEAIADYEAMTAQEQGEMLVQILEDQPVLMGFITNLADDFSESEHETLVDSVVILINAFISAGIPVQMVPHQMVEEVIREKVEVYEEKDKNGELSAAEMTNISENPMVFEDLRNRAFFKSGLAEENLAGRQNFSIVLDSVISIVERSVAQQFDNTSHENTAGDR